MRIAPTGCGVVLYKILFDFEAFVHESIILSLPPPICIALTIAIRLHDYCAIYDAPPPPPPPPSSFSLHTNIIYK